MLLGQATMLALSTGVSDRPMPGCGPTLNLPRTAPELFYQGNEIVFSKPQVNTENAQRRHCGLSSHLQDNLASILQHWPLLLPGEYRNLAAIEGISGRIGTMTK